MIKPSIRRWLLFCQGIILLSFGLSLTVWAKVMGVGPWDSFHLGLTNYIPFNFGQVVQLVGAVAILIGMVLGVKPKLGTILNMLGIGWLANFFLSLFPSGFLVKIGPTSFLVFMAGVVISGVGTGLYIAADVGIGPRDSIMVGFNKKFGIRVGYARTILEVTAVILGFLLGGPIGIGTIIFSLTVGFVVEKTLKSLGKTRSLST